MSIISGDFNARSPLFWDGDPTTREDTKFSKFLIANGMEQLIDEATDIHGSGQSCIDLICTDHPYMFVDSGVLPSLDSHSKHDIIHGRLNFHSPSPPPYRRCIWDFAKANVSQIKLCLSNLDWETLFFRLDVDEMALVFSDTVLDIFSQNIPNKIVTCNDKDPPPG